MSRRIEITKINIFSTSQNMRHEPLEKWWGGVMRQILEAKAGHDLGKRFRKAQEQREAEEKLPEVVAKRPVKAGGHARELEFVEPPEERSTTDTLDRPVPAHVGPSL